MKSGAWWELDEVGSVVAGRSLGGTGCPLSNAKSAFIAVAQASRSRMASVSKQMTWWMNRTVWGEGLSYMGEGITNGAAQIR